MNRLHHLRKTLLKNIHDNSGYAALEILLLDYASTDGTEDWIKNNLKEYLEDGLLIYKRADGPQRWNPSHARNAGFKLCSGDVICNINADYLTGENFASYVNQKFHKDSGIVLTPIQFPKKNNFYNPPKDILGLVCVKKKDFLAIKGFDELMDVYGFEDYDLINRLELLGIKRVLIDDYKDFGFINHDDSERGFEFDGIKILLIHPKDPTCTEILLLYNNGDCFSAEFVNVSIQDSSNLKYAFTEREFRFRYALRDKKWNQGTWANLHNSREIKPISGDHYTLMKEDGGFSFVFGSLVKKFIAVSSREIINRIVMFKHLYHTRIIMERNLDENIIQVNPNNFGGSIIIRD